MTKKRIITVKLEKINVSYLCAETFLLLLTLTLMTFTPGSRNVRLAGPTGLCLSGSRSALSVESITTLK